MKHDRNKIISKLKQTGIPIYEYTIVNDKKDHYMGDYSLNVIKEKKMIYPGNKHKMQTYKKIALKRLNLKKAIDCNNLLIDILK